MIRNISIGCYSFGTELTGKTYNTTSYDFGFNGKENDKEILSNGNWQDYGMRPYRPDNITFPIPDPKFKKYAGISPYVAFADNPILFIDKEGKDIFIHYVDENGKNQAFKYTPGIKPVDNKFVQESVSALDRIHAVDVVDVGETTSPQVMVDQLAYSKSVTVNINNNASSLEDVQTASNGKSANITWNSNIGAELVDNSGQKTGKKQSPSTLLGHELGHALHSFLDFAGFKSDKNDPAKQIPNYDNQEEKNQVTGVETKIANYYGEGVRQNHAGEGYTTISSTSTQEATSTNVPVTTGKEIDLDQK